MARGLSPVELDAESFPEALERLAADMEEWSGVCCGFDVSPGFSLADDQKAIHLYHIAQEALNNAIRHGEPAEVQVRLEQKGQQGILQVSDDGQGIDPNHRSEGLGLKIMRYRAEMIGAQFELESSEQGTKLACKFECGIQEADL
jgi:signal transduction histidine kinase